MNAKHGFVGMIIATALVALSGCGKDDVNGPLNESLANEDAAESIAGTMGQDDGGAMDQLADVADIASPSGLAGGIAQEKLTGIAAVGGLDTTYDAATGTWTVTLNRERGTAGSIPYAHVTRVYTYRFLDASGQPQKHWREVTPSGVDTAVSLVFTIASGSGEHHTAHVSQKLTGISGSWTVTGLNTPTITINGTYSRSAVDTITTRNAVRMLDHTINLTFTNVQIPRGNRQQIAQLATGTISGSYNASVSFQRGSLYGDKTISRGFTVTLGQGKGTVMVGSKAFTALLASGILG